MDRLRRKKESELIRQLAAYSATAAANNQPQHDPSTQPPQSAFVLPMSPDAQSAAAGLTSSASKSNAKKKRGLERLQILEACVDNFHSLEELCHLLRATVNKQQQQLEQLNARAQQQSYASLSSSYVQSSTPLLRFDSQDEQPFLSTPSLFRSLSTLPIADNDEPVPSWPSWPPQATSAVPLADELTQLAMQRSLYSHAFLQAKVALLMVDVDTGMGLDGNEAYASFSGYPRSQLTQRQLLVQRSSVVKWNPSASIAPAHHPINSRRGKRVRKEHSESKMADEISASGVVLGLQQYPQTLQLLQELYAGKRVMITAVWRCPHSDGTVWENSHTSWLAKTDSDIDEAGETTTRPRQIVFASSYEEATKV